MAILLLDFFLSQFVGKVITERIDMYVKTFRWDDRCPTAIDADAISVSLWSRILPLCLWGIVHELLSHLLRIQLAIKTAEEFQPKLLRAPSTVQLGSPDVHRHRDASCSTRYGLGIGVHCWSLRFLARRRNQGLLRTRLFKINGRSSVRWSWHSKILSRANMQCSDLFLFPCVNVLYIDRSFIDDPVPWSLAARQGIVSDEIGNVFNLGT